MAALFISLLTLVLILISAFVVLIVLMQRTSQSGGMGAALGGGAAESAFGSETNNILTKGTIYGIIAFFVVALVLYLIYQSEASDAIQGKDPTLLLPAGNGVLPVENSTDDVFVVTENVEAGEIESAIGTLAEEAQSVTEGVAATAEGVVNAVEVFAEESAEAVPEEIPAPASK